MKLIALVSTVILMAGCTATEKKQTIPIHAAAAIINAAVNDIKQQGCEPLSVNESRGYIWCQCIDNGKGVVKRYDFRPLVEKYFKKRALTDTKKAGDTENE